MESEVKTKVTRSCPTLCNPMDYTVHEIVQARILEWVAVPFSRGLSNPEIEPKNSTLQEDSLPAEPPRKRKNTGVGSCGREQISQDGSGSLTPRFVNNNHVTVEIIYSTAHAHHKVLTWSGVTLCCRDM